MNPFYSRTFILCCFVAIIDRADQMLLPAVYFEVASSLQLGPLMLATISACRGITESISSLISGLLGDTCNRVHMITVGCLIWAVSTAAVGASTNITWLIIARMINGFGLGFVTPPVFGIVSDMFAEDQRGQAFGLIGTSSNLGAALGSMLATSVAGSMKNGWRIAFYIIAGVALLLALFIWLLGKEPRVFRINKAQTSSFTSIPISEATNVKDINQIKKDIYSVLKLKTFWILSIQGIFFEVPWYAMNFFTMWLELSGWSNYIAAGIRLCFDIGMTSGVLIGGKLSDISIMFSRNYGRVFVSQVSIGLGIPLWIIILKINYNGSEGAIILGLIVLVTGLLTQWGFPCKTAMLAEISPRDNLRTLMYALSRAGEGTLAAMASPIVGVLAEKVFNFKDQNDEDDRNDDNDGDDSWNNHKDAQALSQAMMVAMVTPWSLCVIVLSLAYYTYPKERTVVQENADIEITQINDRDNDDDIDQDQFGEQRFGSKKDNRASQEHIELSTVNPIHF